MKTRACTMRPSMKNTQTNDSDLLLSSSRQKLNIFAFPKSPKRTASPAAVDFLKPHTIGSVCNMHTCVFILLFSFYTLIPPFFAEHVLLMLMSLAFPAFSSRPSPFRLVYQYGNSTCSELLLTGWFDTTITKKIFKKIREASLASPFRYTPLLCFPMKSHVFVFLFLSFHVEPCAFEEHHRGTESGSLSGRSYFSFVLMIFE